MEAEAAVDWRLAMLTKKRREETAWSRELPKVGSMEVACERMMRRQQWVRGGGGHP